MGARIEPTGPDQLWVADIAYVRLAEGFVYLAVVIDAFSRKAVGFALDNHLEARLALAALDMAVAERKPRLGLALHGRLNFSYNYRGWRSRADGRDKPGHDSEPSNGSSSARLGISPCFRAMPACPDGSDQAAAATPSLRAAVFPLSKRRPVRGRPDDYEPTR